MNKSLVCLALCTFTAYSMDRPDTFGDALNPERIVGAAVSDLFSGPLPVVTQHTPSETSATEKEFVEMAGVFQAFDPAIEFEENQKKSTHLRRLISLNEAIRFGSFDALTDKERGNIIEFRDFQTCDTAPRTSFSMEIKEVNKHIFTTLLKSQTETVSAHLKNASKVKDKIMANAQDTLSQEELLAYQTPKVMGFLTYADIEGAKEQIIEKIQNDDDVSNNQKKSLTSKIEAKATIALNNRILYLAALATQDPAVINQRRTTPFQSPFTDAAPLVEEVAHLRAKARNKTNPAELAALLRTLQNGQGGVRLMSAEDCIIS